MYKVGNIKYKSKRVYDRQVYILFLIFTFNLIVLQTLREHMSVELYWFVTIIDILMMIHLSFKHLNSYGKIKYIFNEY